VVAERVGRDTNRDEFHPSGANQRGERSEPW
jgi:hypothetical protein